jgi:membrane associated rhomboid family serine protease
MVFFLIIVGFIMAILSVRMYDAFMTNPGLNGLIAGVLGVGILLSFIQVIRLIPEVSWVNSFRRGETKTKRKRDPKLLAPMAALLGSTSDDGVSLSTNSMRSILDSIGTRLDESRDILRYLIGLLVFLGLLGTFWGLLGTIGSIGDTIQSLDPDASGGASVLDDLKRGLNAPLEGMGTAFSSSLFGLAGSLILGFLDLQAGRAQNRFYTELENWLSSVTEINLDLAPTVVSGGSNEDMAAALESLAAKMQTGGGSSQSTAAVANLAEGVQGLVKHMRNEQQQIRQWAQAQGQQQAEIKQLLISINKQLNE